MDETQIRAHIEGAVGRELVEGQGERGECRGDGHLVAAAAQLGCDAVVDGRLEAEQPGGHRTVERERTAVAGRGAKRIAVNDFESGAQLRHILGQGFGIRPQPQAERGGHRQLTVGITGQQHFLVPLAQLLENVKKFQHLFAHLVQFPA